MKFSVVFSLLCVYGVCVRETQVVSPDHILFKSIPHTLPVWVGTFILK